MSRVSHGAVVPQENLGHQIGGLFLSSSGLIRCNSIPDTVQLSISTFHVSVMAITPAIASHKVRILRDLQTSRCCSWLPTEKVGCRDLGIGAEGDGVWSHGAKGETQTSECGSTFPNPTRMRGNREAPRVRMQVSTQRAGCAFYEIDPTNGATIEIFCADRVVAQSFGAQCTASKSWLCPQSDRRRSSLARSNLYCGIEPAVKEGWLDVRLASLVARIRNHRSDRNRAVVLN
jgi:hypothetical protein